MRMYDTDTGFAVLEDQQDMNMRLGHELTFEKRGDEVVIMAELLEDDYERIKCLIYEFRVPIEKLRELLEKKQ